MRLLLRGGSAGIRNGRYGEAAVPLPNENLDNGYSMHYYNTSEQKKSKLTIILKFAARLLCRIAGFAQPLRQNGAHARFLSPIWPQKCILNLYTSGKTAGCRRLAAGGYRSITRMVPMRDSRETYG